MDAERLAKVRQVLTERRRMTASAFLDMMASLLSEVDRLTAELAQRTVERDQALAKVDEVATNAVDMLLGSCTADDQHGIDRMSFAAFCQTEGVRCSLCVAAERDQARADLAASVERVRVLEEAICYVLNDHDHGVEGQIPCHSILDGAMLATRPSGPEQGAEG